MSSKQLARTVVDGKRVRFTTSAAVAVEGYLCGMDDYHWMVVTPGAEVVLVHKSAPLIEIGVAGMYASEPNLDTIEKIVRPFRDSLQESGLVPQRPLSVVSAT
jgi:hypothetical protein